MAGGPRRLTIKADEDAQSSIEWFGPRTADRIIDAIYRYATTRAGAIAAYSPYGGVKVDALHVDAAEIRFYVDGDEMVITEVCSIDGSDDER